MPTAQQAATGARICIASAIRTIGRKFRNRRRIDHSTLLERYQLITRTHQCRDVRPSTCLHNGQRRFIPRYEMRRILSMGLVRFIFRPALRRNEFA